MKEGIATRVSRIISGSVNAIIGAVESAAPTVMMEEAIREIDGAIDELQSEIRELASNRRMANARLMEENRKHEDLADKLALALRDDRDDLAKVAIAQQLDIEAQIPVLERAIGEASERENELDSYLTALRAKRREMMEDLRTYISSRDQSGPSPDDSATVSTLNDASERVTRKAESAESGFNRILEQQTGLSCSTSGNNENAVRLAELEELARSNRVQERLLEAKRNSTT